MSRKYVYGDGGSYVEGNTLYGRNGENLGYVSDSEKNYDDVLRDRINNYDQRQEEQNNYFQKDYTANSNEVSEDNSQSQTYYNYGYGEPFINPYDDSSNSENANWTKQTNSIDYENIKKANSKYIRNEIQSKRSLPSYTSVSLILSILTIFFLYILEKKLNIDIMPDPSINVDVIFSYIFIVVFVFGVLSFIRWIFTKSKTRKSFLSLIFSSFIQGIVLTIFLLAIFVTLQDNNITIPYLSGYFSKLMVTILQLSNGQNSSTLIKLLNSFTPGWVFFFIVGVIKQRGFL
ncbi:oligosaccharide flippase family protein [Clostridium sp. 'White wine YQ']|uniref:oligosaccharide flippase family protein n=1 Tax=Clostridium sp. 'White wine YQ' TaxID=3027474 RepID=UPI00236646CF|nr:oligosaccharide flippase family protein [Clostridium sp. 'White wine YQ']MDD7793872.1 oligosaccharide flippase family protein [Clostridium sp. 'White wine YQ']